MPQNSSYALRKWLHVIIKHAEEFTLLKAQLSQAGLPVNDELTVKKYYGLKFPTC